MSAWFKKFNYNNDCTLRLFCFPYAGGSAAVFQDWNKVIPRHIDLFALQAPGRGERFQEKPISSLRTLVDLVHKEIKLYLDKPAVFFGHSNGALLAYELAQEIRKQDNVELQHLIISAKKAPHLPFDKRILHQLPDSDFIDALRDYNSIPEEVLENTELMDLLLPMLRADFSLSETHHHSQTDKLTNSVSLFWGNQDPHVSKQDMLGWQNLFSCKVSFLEFNGDHFFVTKNQNHILNTLASILKEP